MGENTTISTLPKVSNTNGTELLKTHIARRKATDGPIADYTLCGRLWDRAHPTSGEIVPGVPRHLQSRAAWVAPAAITP